MNARATPATALAAYRRRRRQLMRMAGEDAILILPAAPERVRSRDTYHPYRQDSDVLYLSGFEEPEAVLVLVPGRSHGESLLFCRERDPEREAWDGPRVGPEGAPDALGVDDAYAIDDIDEILPGLLEGRSRVYYHFGRDTDFDLKLIGWLNRVRAQVRHGAQPPHEFLELGHLLDEMRLIKGADANACVLHYRANDAVARKGDLVLVDAGAEYRGYAADITRTFPVDGRFSREQRALHDLVGAAHAAALAQARPGVPWEAGHKAAVDVLAEGMLSLGLLKGRLEKVVADGAYRRFYPHKTGHWIGLDVHDVGDYRIDGESRLLEPGMVYTIEPGIYIPPGDTSVAAKWRGIGIRTEDDVAITRDGHEVLTEGLARSADEIEAFMAG